MPLDTAQPPFSSSSSQRSYRGVAPEQRAEERRQRLLAAGLELFARQGYAHTPIEQLCTEAKVTTRHFYALFASREALLTALYDDIVTDLRSAVLAAISLPGQTLEEKIPLAVQTMVEHYLTDSRRARVGVLESVGVSAAMERRRRGAIHAMASGIEHYMNLLVSRGEFPPRNFHLTSVAIVGGINELLAEWLTIPEPPGIQSFGNEIVRILQALLLGSALLPAPMPSSLSEPSA